MSDEKNNAPLQRIPDGNIVAKIWEQSGPQGSFPTVTIERVFKNDETQEWGTSNSYNREEALKLEKLMPEITKEVGKWGRFFKEQHRTQQQQAEVPEPQPEQIPASEEVGDLLAQRDAALSKAVEPTPSPDYTPLQGPER